MSDDSGDNGNPNVQVDAVVSAYAEEEQAAEIFEAERLERACDTALGTAIGFIPYVGPLLEPGCIAPDPARYDPIYGRILIDERTEIVVKKIEAALKVTLDAQTRQSIWDDVKAIWFSW
ncbi:MAG: hypothetical protein AABZ53_05660 [Planctomycetota bacterium]